MLPVKSNVSSKCYLLVELPFSALLFWPPADTAVPLLFLAEIPGGLCLVQEESPRITAGSRCLPASLPLPAGTWCYSPLTHPSLSAGTSPHAPTSVHVVVAMTSANVSWEPGYDGGYEQTFSVWYGPL